MNKRTKTQEIIESLGKILSELDEKQQDIVALRIAEALSDLAKVDPAERDDQDI